MKNKEIHIRITKEKYNIIKLLAAKDRRKQTEVIDIALDNYFKQRKVSKG